MASDYRQILTDPDFVELQASRGRLGWTLAIVMMAIYFGFIFLVAFAPGVMAMNVGGVVTLGFPLGLAVIVSAIVITGLYVLRANGSYDALTRRIVDRAR